MNEGADISHSSAQESVQPAPQTFLNKCVDRMAIGLTSHHEFIHTLAGCGGILLLIRLVL